MIRFGALLGDSIAYHDIPSSFHPISSRIEENEFPYEKEERDLAYLKSREGNKSLSVFDTDETEETRKVS